MKHGLYEGRPASTARDDVAAFGARHPAGASDGRSIVEERLTSPYYWWFQLAGWTAFAALSYLSLTLWYNPGELTPALHTLLQSALGIVVSHPLRFAAKALWSAGTTIRISANTAAVIAASLAWTALRLTSFTWLTGEVIPPADYGGWIFASVIVFAAWAFCYHALVYYRQLSDQTRLVRNAEEAALRAQARAREESVKRLEAEAHFREAQLRMLRYQLNPHFLFNALNSVSSLVRKKDEAGATTMLARIGDFLRQTLVDDEERANTLEDELEAIELYLSIERIRFGSRLHTEFFIDEKALPVALPKLLLQPLFENAMKHAVGRTLDTVTLRLDGRVTDGRLVLTLTDDGPGLAEPGVDGSPASLGIGLSNVEARLKSAYGPDFAFNLASEGARGTKVTLDLPSSGYLNDSEKISGEH